MADEADIADQYAEAHLAAGLARLKAQQPSYKESADECIECGALIPSARQLALPGVQTCVDCATILEARSRGYAR